MIYSLASSADGKWVAAGALRGIAVFSTENSPGTVIPTETIAWSVCFHPGGSYLAAGIQSRGVVIYGKLNPSEGNGRWKEVGVFEVPGQATVFFDRDGNLLSRDITRGALAPIDRWKVVNPQREALLIEGMTSVNAFQRYPLLAKASDPIHGLTATSSKNGIDLWDDRPSAFADRLTIDHDAEWITAVRDREAFVAKTKDGIKSEIVFLANRESKWLHQSGDQELPALDQLNKSKQERWRLGLDRGDLKQIQVTTSVRGLVASLPHDKGVSSYAITDTNSWVATSTVDKTIYLWPLDPAVVLEKACKDFLPRNLTAKEFEYFRIPKKYQFPACPNLTDQDK